MRLFIPILTIIFTAMTAPAQTFFQPNDRVLFEGDSLTDGLKNNCGRMMGWDKTWAHRVDEWLFAHRPDLNLESKNLAVGGSSAKSLLARADADAAFKPMVAMLTIGTNDAIMNVPEETFRGKMTFVGNIDPSGVMARGTPDLVVQRTASLLDTFAGEPRFIINSGCALPSSTPEENIRAAARKTTP